MTFTRFTFAMLFLGTIPLASCTAKYEDMIRDRDIQIREKDKANSDLRTEVAELRRREQEARDALDAERRAAENNKAVEPAATVRNNKKNDDLNEIRKEVGDGVEVRYNRGRVSIGIPSTVTFASGSATLTDEGRRTLGRVAKVLHDRFANKRIYIEGHTDSDPIKNTKDKFRSNRHLSAERADAVATWMVEKGGVRDANVAIVGYGEFDPVAKGGDKARNRRVEIVIGD